MNSERKERREVQLAKKAETIEAAASEVLVINETRIKIDGRPYDLVENYHEGFNAERLGERFSQILTKYDYIVGDWGYDQLRLRGFYEIGSKKGSPYQSIERLDDYLYEYCNFGCSYFILHNLEVHLLILGRRVQRENHNLVLRNITLKIMYSQMKRDIIYDHRKIRKMLI